MINGDVRSIRKVREAEAAHAPVYDPHALARSGPAGAAVAGVLGVMGQMAGAVQASMMVLRDMQRQVAELRREMRDGDRREGGRPTVVVAHPDMMPPQWDHRSQQSQLTENSPPPYRMQNGEHW
jgi:hypothetical protein